MTVQPNVIEHPSPNHGPRPTGATIDILLLHYTDMARADDALDRMCDPAAQVSAHYLVGEDGRIWRMVSEDRRAWHAGVSWWDGESDINSRSIGIELSNPGHSHGYRPFPDAQMSALESLCQGILARHPIPPSRVLGHSDVSPGRKIDPGHLFDWRRLASRGIGLWPTDAAPADLSPEDITAALATIGYRTETAELADPTMRSALWAFRRHWCSRPLNQPFDRHVGGMLKAVSEAVKKT
ncbi:N-acetylmuramoyl-L-alanine amidase [Thalassobaculum sp.]|uniref:N-acetylmuramoyl-L-alanine amidase n=1 Tax=Thalassobaculum sp. TaxID=2022740 RepID=UPI0032EE1186